MKGCMNEKKNACKNEIPAVSLSSYRFVWECHFLLFLFVLSGTDFLIQFSVNIFACFQTWIVYDM